MCDVCNHPQRDALEQDIRAGAPPARVAKQYGLRHHAVVLQHERRHMLNLHGNPLIVQSARHAKPSRLQKERIDETPASAKRLKVQTERLGKSAALDLPPIDEAQPPVIILGVQSEPSFTQADLELAQRRMPLMPSGSRQMESDTHLRMGGIVGQGSAPTDDPLRRARFHASALAAAWRDVEPAQRTPERLQVILQDAFAEQEMGG